MSAELGWLAPCRCLAGWRRRACDGQPVERGRTPPAPLARPACCVCVCVCAGIGQHTLLLYNNVLALAPMATWLVLGTRELPQVAAYPRLRDPSFLAFLLVSCSQAFLLNLAIFRRARGGAPRAHATMPRCRMRSHSHAGHRASLPTRAQSVHDCRCTLVNSPLATNVTGQAKDVATTALGWALFGDVR